MRLRQIGSGIAGGLALLAGACGGAPAAREADTTGGLYHVTWTPSRSPIPYNELFELDVQVSAAGATVGDATLGLTVVMPVHGHGMQTTVEIDSIGPGRFRVHGLKFHMRGDWRLTFAVGGPAGEDTAIFAETLP